MCPDEPIPRPKPRVRGWEGASPTVLFSSAPPGNSHHIVDFHFSRKTLESGTTAGTASRAPRSPAPDLVARGGGLAGANDRVVESRATAGGGVRNTIAHAAAAFRCKNPLRRMIDACLDTTRCDALEKQLVRDFWSTRFIERGNHAFQNIRRALSFAPRR